MSSLNTDFLSASTFHGSSSKDDEKEDLFATLFSPPTPPASPIPLLLFDTSSPSTSKSTTRSRTSSSSSDFGSFVSVSAFDDPLQSEEQEQFTSLHNLDFFESFTEGAAKANAENQKVLEELLEHEDDPLYWLNVHDDFPNGETVANERVYSGSTTPIPRTSSPDSVTSAPWKMVDTIPSLIDSELEPIRNHPSRDRNVTEPTISSSPLFRSPTFSSVKSRILSSIRPTNSVPVSFTDNTSASGFFDPPSQSSSPLHQSIPPPSPGPARRPLPDITHGTPFSSQIYTPPSGAPGFTGDRNWNKSNFEFNEVVNNRNVKLTGRKEFTTPVLTVELANEIRCYLPALRRLANSWSLLYSLEQHGISLNTVYSRCMNYTGSGLMVIRDSNEKLFGIWLGETIRPSKGSYYGSGESFLWKLKRNSDDGVGKLQVFKWTGRNDYVALCEPGYLSFGGGDGKYGLYLDDTLLDGSSACCPTFANEPLCSCVGPRDERTVDFECVGLEVWGIGGA